MTPEAERAEQLRTMLKKAQTTLAAAKELHGRGYYDDAASRAYYALFHALQAALLTKDLAVSKHSAVLAAFNTHFIRPGLLTDPPFRVIKRLSKDRQNGDYQYGWNTTAERCQLDIADAERTISAVTSLLKAGGFLGPSG